MSNIHNNTDIHNIYWGERAKTMTMTSVRQLPALLQRFFQQRKAAQRRGIEWNFDFCTWLAVWEDSGHLQERRRRKGQWQMCRSGDIGPYASSNVRIDRMEANASEGQITKCRLRLERQASLYGGVHVAQISAALTESLP